MKKKYIITLSLLAFIVALSAIWYGITRSTQGDATLDHPLDETVVEMPLGGLPIAVEVTPGISFKFDTGADISTLSDKDVERLRALGYEVEESWKPIAGRDGYGDFIFSPRRYTVSLPLGGYRRQADSTGVVSLVYSGSPANVMRNVDFAPCGDNMSTLGLDVLRRFKLERAYRSHSLLLHESVPAGYQSVAKLEKSLRLSDIFWSSHRCYIVVSVNQVPHIFFVDTGLQRAAVKMPYADSVKMRHPLKDDSISTMNATYKARLDESAWIDFGNRSGTKKVYFYENPEYDYQINPLNVFAQDLVLDIDGGEIFFRPQIN